MAHYPLNGLRIETGVGGFPPDHAISPDSIIGGTGYVAEVLVSFH